MANAPYKSVVIKLNRDEYELMRRFQLAHELAGNPATSLAQLSKTEILKIAQRKVGSSNV